MSDDELMELQTTVQRTEHDVDHLVADVQKLKTENEELRALLFTLCEGLKVLPSFLTPQVNVGYVTEAKAKFSSAVGTVQSKTSPR